MEHQFGLDQPLIPAIRDYMSNVLRLDFGYSLKKYPSTVMDVIAQAVPWTLGLLFVTAILSSSSAIFSAPSPPGRDRRVAAWLRHAIHPPNRRAAGADGSAPPLLRRFSVQLLPLGGAYSIGAIPNWSWSFALDLGQHQILPALALIFGSLGGWVLSMRGMGVTIQGEDYVTFAEHKGLTDRRIFRDYYLRNALLPQVTGFALALGTVVTSAIVVEGIFYLPGIGSA